MAPAVRDYVNYGAEDEESLRSNREGFARYALRPRILKNASEVDTSITILQGRLHLSMPVCISPFAGCVTIHPEKEFAIAAAAVEAGIVYTMANYGGTPVRDLVEEHVKRTANDSNSSHDSSLFFQVYPQKPKSIYIGIRVSQQVMSSNVCFQLFNQCRPEAPLCVHGSS